MVGSYILPDSEDMSKYKYETESEETDNDITLTNFSTRLGILPNTTLGDIEDDDGIEGSFLGNLKTNIFGSKFGKLFDLTKSEEAFNNLTLDQQQKMTTAGWGKDLNGNIVKVDPLTGKILTFGEEPSLLSKYKDEVDIGIAATKIGLGAFNHNMLKDYYKSEIETKKRALALNEKIVENKKNIGNAFHS